MHEEQSRKEQENEGETVDILELDEELLDEVRGGSNGNCNCSRTSVATLA
jgi:hypothetical protein